MDLNDVGVEKMENKINNLANLFKGQYSRPVMAFVTFSTQDGFDHCLQTCNQQSGFFF
jgi:hypothetical protein